MQNRWLAEQVRVADKPANGGDVEEQPPMDPSPQDFLHEERHYLEGELHEQMSDDENMEKTEDMDTKSVGLTLRELDRGQRELVERCEREILVAIRSLGGYRKAHTRERACWQVHLHGQLSSQRRFPGGRCSVLSHHQGRGKAPEVPRDRRGNSKWHVS